MRPAGISRSALPLIHDDPMEVSQERKSNLSKPQPTTQPQSRHSGLASVPSHSVVPAQDAVSLHKPSKRHFARPPEGENESAMRANMQPNRSPTGSKPTTKLSPGHAK